MYEAAASCKDIVRAPVTNWEPQCVNAPMLLCREVRMKVQLATPYRVTHSQHYEVRLRGNVTGLRYAVTLQVFVQLVTPYRVTHLQRY